MIVATGIVVAREYAAGEQRLTTETTESLLVRATVAADRLEAALAERARMVTLWATLETSQDLAFDDVDTRLSATLQGLMGAFGDGSDAVAVRDGVILSSSDPARLGPGAPSLPPAVREAVARPAAGVVVARGVEPGWVVATADVQSVLDGRTLGRLVVWTPLDRFLSNALPLDVDVASFARPDGEVIALGEAVRGPEDDFLWSRHLAHTAAGDVIVSMGRPRADIVAGLRSTLRQLVTLAALVLLLALPATILVVRSATASLGRLTRAARELDPARPDPLPRPSRWAPSEVRVLADALSGMVTRLEEARAEVARAESLAAVGVLTKSLAHEIRTPLSVLRGGTEILARSSAPGSREAEITDMLSSEVARLSRLMDDLLVFGRPSPPVPRETDARAICRDALDALGADAADADVTLRLEGESVPLRADPDQLRQIVVNLVSNGVRACEGGGTVLVSVGTRDGRAVLDVSDDGAGIPADRLDEIWTPLVTTHRRGNGLGLPIVRQLVEAHGGVIHVQSTPGSGTRMRVELPLSPGGTP